MAIWIKRKRRHDKKSQNRMKKTPKTGHEDEIVKEKSASETISGFSKEFRDMLPEEDRAFFDDFGSKAFKDVEEMFKNEEELQEAMEKHKMKIKGKRKSTRLGTKDRSAQKDSVKAEDWYYKGRSHADLREFDKAIKCYKKALSIDPEYADAWNGKGECVFKRTETDFGFFMQKTAPRFLKRAIKCFNKALMYDDGCIDAWKNKGGVLNFAKQFGKAAECYSEALKRDSEDSEAWFGKGTSYFGLENYPKALTCYSKAIEIDPDQPETWLLKGYAHMKTSMPKEAKICLKKVLDLVPPDDDLAASARQSLYSLQDVEINESGEIEIEKPEVKTISTASNPLAEALETVHLGYGKENFLSMLDDVTEQQIGLTLREHIHKFEPQFFEFLLSFSSRLKAEGRHEAAHKLIFLCKEATRLLTD